MLLAVWNPEEAAGVAKDMLRTAFVEMTRVPMLATQSPRAAKLIEQQGAKFVAGQPQSLPTGLPEGMMLHRLLLPCGLYGELRKKHPGPDDPFSEKIPLEEWSQWITEWLVTEGVEFPEGASVSVQNDLCVNCVATICNRPTKIHQAKKALHRLHSIENSMVNVVTHLVQGNGEFIRRLIRETTGSVDHTAAWASVEAAVRNQQAVIRHTLWQQDCDRGQASSSAGLNTIDHYWTAGEILDSHLAAESEIRKPPSAGGNDAATNPNGKEAPPPPSPNTLKLTIPTPSELKFNIRPYEKFVGLDMNADLFLSEDRERIDLDLRILYENVMPTPRPELPPPAGVNLAVRELGLDLQRMYLKQRYTLLNGRWRLVDAWKPTGDLVDKDTYVACFVRAFVVKPPEEAEPEK